MEETFPVVNRLTGTTINIQCFLDDTIETIGFRIGDAVNIHPDRLRIYVKIELDRDYYAKDSRKWENLFLRMSPEGKIITNKSLSAYNSARDPAYEFTVAEFDKSSWMALSPDAETSFTELRIFGVPEERSWVFPLKNEAPEFLPPSTMTTIEVKALLKTLHPQKIRGFEVIPHSEGLSPQVELVYFPRLRMGTPAMPQPDVIRNINRHTELLRGLFDISVPNPDKISIVQARWKLQLVDSDFGSAVRNRFEQIFYGTTLSRNLPSISFFGGRQEQSRHKFHTETVEKTPFVDLKNWNHWWTITRPSKNRPSLLLYRGTTRTSFDRITINPIEITLSSSRGPESTENVDDIKNNLKEFLLSIDGISSYLSPADYEDDRWDLQDISAVLHYSKELKEADFRRFDCLRNIYDLTNPEKLSFKFLRSDQSDTGLTDEEIRVIQLLKENEYTTPEDIHEQLSYKSTAECAILLEGIRQKIDDNSELIDRLFLNVPTFRMTSKQVAVTHVTDIKRITKYISILRDILINPDNSSLDSVCPKRVEVIPAETAVVPVSVAAQEAVEEENDYLDDLLAEVSEVSIEKAPVVEEPKIGEEKKSRKVKAKGVTTLATYFLDQLHEFDPMTFDPDDTQILRKCDRPRQPIVMKESELEKFKDDLAEYAPQDTLEVKDPNGIVICPEFWCTIDRIPLRKDQLNEGKCPVCGGKIRSTERAVEKTQSVVEYPVLVRDPSIVYPGYVKYKSKKNDRPIPCCFTTSQKTKITMKALEIQTPQVELFYILGESKTGLEELRLAYLPSIVIKAFRLPINYNEFMEASNRLQTGRGSYFRVGVGHAGTTLPKILEMNVVIKPPIENPDITVKCSFFRTWKGSDVDYDIPGYEPALSRRIASIDKAYREGQLAPLEELEYACMALNCMTYIVYVNPDSIQSGCFMTFSAVRNVKRAVLILIDSTGSPDYFVHVSKTSSTPTIRGNLYNTLFPPELLKNVESLRSKSCVRDVPTIEKALIFITRNEFLKTRIPEMKVIIDPYRRAQALFLPNEIILPIYPTSQIPTILNGNIYYSDIPQTEYPLKTKMIGYLNEAKKVHAGYEYAHDAGNIKNAVVEIITRCGFRIPVQTADTSADFEEITETTNEVSEQKLTFGKPDQETKKLANSITYEAEIFEFLLYQLSNDLIGDDFPTLKGILSQVHPSIEELREPLRQWMSQTIQFSEAEEPSSFYSKIRHTCRNVERDKCTGLCVWDGMSCKVQVKKARSSLQLENLERRLLSTLSSNDKIRTIVFDHRVSPFFSSVLYLEIPSEVILSDQDVSNLLK